MSRNACARSSSFRTIARTALPCFSSSSVTVRPIAPTRPAAPVIRMGFAMFYPPMRSSNRQASAKRERKDSNAGFEKLDLKSSVLYRALLPNELIHSRLPDLAGPVGIRIDSVIVTRSDAAQPHLEAHRLPAHWRSSPPPNTPPPEPPPKLSP